MIPKEYTDDAALCQWLRDNSSGNYRLAAYAAERIETLLDIINREPDAWVLRQDEFIFHSFATKEEALNGIPKRKNFNVCPVHIGEEIEWTS